MASVWRRRGESVTHLDGARATEAAVKDLAPGKRILHLATHGFFLGSCERGVGASRGAAPASAGEPPSSGPGGEAAHLSGLALAGANLRHEAAPDEEDGILTTEEVASLDLGGVEWAVLSACDTGLGDVRAGEGVLGLRRAFQVAGARTVVMSLWPVDDEAAREWMRELYRARLRRGLDTASAVREASLAVLRERRAHGLDDSPATWGAFVAAGDWR